ncbi:MAG: hypothetical protein JWP57_3262 [Spirosoma sp.]|nr:hypothetical protein [Spirosoma sp.]
MSSLVRGDNVDIAAKLRANPFFIVIRAKIYPMLRSLIINLQADQARFSRLYELE